MRGSTYSVLLVGAALGLPSGCAGSQSQNALTPFAAPAATAATQHPAQPSHAKQPHDLYILSRSQSVVYMLHDVNYRDLGVITNGVSGPSDAFVDKKGNLYVANSNNVAEYAPGATSPTFYYSAGMSSPVSVAVDAHGNVFEGDTNGNINEYFQGYNAVAASCFIYEVAAPTGLAVDSTGDVFFNASDAGYFNSLIEFYGGLAGCHSSGYLAGSGMGVEGLAVDSKNNLLVAAGNVVNVVPPPYASVSGTIGSGFNGASDVKLNKANTLAFVTDTTNHTVTVVSYPGGSNITVLGASNGLVAPYAAVEAPNSVP
jgi:hypothetical protein